MIGTKKTRALCTVVATAVLALSAAFAGPAASEDLDALAKRLDRECKQECKPYMDRATSNPPNIRATYEGMACTCMCFLRGLPADYEGRDGVLQCAKDNSRLARELGSNAPVLMNR